MNACCWQTNITFSLVSLFEEAISNSVNLVFYLLICADILIVTLLTFTVNSVSEELSEKLGFSLYTEILIFLLLLKCVKILRKSLFI